MFDALAKAGFVTLEGVGSEDVSATSFPGAGARALLVGGPESTITASGTTVELTQALVAAKALTAVGEVDPDEATNRGVWLAPIRNDDQLKRQVSTIDDVDLVQGRVSATLALAVLARGVVGCVRDRRGRPVDRAGDPRGALTHPGTTAGREPD